MSRQRNFLIIKDNKFVVICGGIGMFENMTEEQAKKQILDMVSEYCDTYHNQRKPFEEGDRISYASPPHPY